MEKIRASVVSEQIRHKWHSRKSMSLGVNSARFYRIHEEPATPAQVRQHQQEITIFDIRRNVSPEKIEKLGIKHITKEK